MLRDIKDAWSHNGHVALKRPPLEKRVQLRNEDMPPHILPRHARLFKDGNLVTGIVVNVFEICKACIIVVLPRKKCLVELRWMHVGKRAAT
jgi:hypothetical protein